MAKVKLTMGEKLKDLRNERNVTVKQLSQITNVSVGTINSIENDSNEYKNFGYKTLLAICKYFDVSFEWFIGHRENRTPKEDIQDICDYTGFDEKTLFTLHNFTDANKQFICEMIAFAEDNKFIIPSFLSGKELMLSLYNNGNAKKDAYLFWKDEREMRFTNSQFNLQAAFNRYIISDDVVTAKKHFDEIENKINQEKAQQLKELETLNIVAWSYGYSDWCELVVYENKYFKDRICAEEWLNHNNLNISDNTIDYIVSVVRECGLYQGINDMES